MTKIEKLIIAFLSSIILMISSFIFLLNSGYIDLKTFLNKFTKNVFSQTISLYDTKNPFKVYQNDKFINNFDTYEKALEYAVKYENSSIRKLGEEGFVYDSVPQFNVYVDSNEWYMAFDNIKDAIDYAKQYGNADIINRKNSKIVWSNKKQLKESYLISNVPYIGQYPELYRGCEVTSLAMLLNYKGINVSKMTLAQEVEKDTTPLKIVNGVKNYGHPNVGFVGDIYSSKNNGLGVYHKPIYNLLQKYIGEYAIDLTGSEFNDLYYYLEKDIPVWIITNTKFKKLPESSFETWNTSQGQIKVTYSEHSVLVTGYDQNYIYYNDPMYPNKTYKKPKNEFIEAYNQMGKQAVTYYK